MTLRGCKRKCFSGVLVCLALVACSPGQSTNKPSNSTESMSPPDAGTNLFSPFYNSDETPQSPKPPNPNWRGVLIDAPPESVVTLRQPMVLLRGTYRIQGTNYPANDRLRIIAIDPATKKEFS